jgi:U6 snRNA phosphodiesterase
MPARDLKRKSTSKKMLKTSWDDMKDVSDAFHISIAWTLTEPGLELQELTKAMVTDHMKDLSQIQVKIEEIKSKVGNLVTNISLPRTVSVGKGLFGI